MKISIRKGFGFGLTSGIITTLGLIVGLHSGTHSRLVILGGIFVIAIADSFSDALGIHVSEEAERGHKQKAIWESTVATFFSKFIFTLTFVVPILLFSLFMAIVVSIIWGLFLITLFSLYVARIRGMKPFKVVVEHLTIAVLVIIATHFVGDLVAKFFVM